jgi:hypothetical protein
LPLGPGHGKHSFNVRQRLVRDHYAPLIRTKGIGAVKLDILLRCIAFSPEHQGGRKHPGAVHHAFSYEWLHDLVKDEPDSDPDREPDEQQVRALKRKWVRDQLVKLQERQLVRVTTRDGRRSDLEVLRDDASGEPYDNPATSWAESQKNQMAGDHYFKLNGWLIKSGQLRAWGAPEVAMFFAALLAEQHHPRGANRKAVTDGTGTWIRPLKWFADGNMEPRRRTLLRVSVTSLETGLIALRRSRLITVKTVLRDPRDPRRRFSQPRNLYTNHFDRLARDFGAIDEPDDRPTEKWPSLTNPVLREPVDNRGRKRAAAPKSSTGGHRTTLVASAASGTPR